MRALVTGAAGFIGSHVVAALVAAGMVGVGAQVIDRQVRAVHAERRQQPGSQEVLP